jgi:glyoxylase-like metal-dependent hydrolase (beta-lactamase superfamily II)
MGTFPETSGGAVSAMGISVRTFITGPLETNTYVISEAPSCIVVDPSEGCGDPLRMIRGEKMSVVAVLLTHCHFDHVLGIAEILAENPAAGVWAHAAEKPLLTNAEYNGSFLIGRPFVYNGPVSELSEGPSGDTIRDFSFDVLHVPGHSPGGCAFVFKNSGAGAAHCFSGDALFAGSIGRYDFPLSNGPLLIKSITEKLLALPDDTIVYPGHGGRTTIGREKRMNPFLSGAR